MCVYVHAGPSPVHKKVASVATCVTDRDVVVNTELKDVMRLRSYIYLRKCSWRSAFLAQFAIERSIDPPAHGKDAAAL